MKMKKAWFLFRSDQSSGERPASGPQHSGWRAAGGTGGAGKRADNTTWVFSKGFWELVTAELGFER